MAVSYLTNFFKLKVSQELFFSICLELETSTHYQLGITRYCMLFINLLVWYHLEIYTIDSP